MKADLTPDQLRTMPLEQLRALAGDLVARGEGLRKECQMLYYMPASDAAAQIHLSGARIIGAGGGNRSGKTESVLAEAVALATGVLPLRFHQEFRAKFQGPINVRLCVKSLTATMHPVILPKLKWWVWTGLHPQGGEQGHWGWVPKMCLKAESWDKSWSEKLRTLTVLCRDPDDHTRVMGESQIQILSYDQDVDDHASGTFHIVICDEPPPYAIWRENQARTLDVNGRIFLSMTWPDDPSIPVDWIYDEVYERGQPGPLKDPNVDWFELQTLENRNLNAAAVLEQTAGWSEESRKVKLQGQPLRFSNRIHPLFTDAPQSWCFACQKVCLPVDDKCGCVRESKDIAAFCHLEHFEVAETWPVVFLLDPHPRKPHMFCWVSVDPADDYWIVQEGEIEGDAADLRDYVFGIEESMRLDVRLRLMDPNMGRSPSGARREITWQDEFQNAGLQIDLADDSEVGRKRVNQYLKPDPATRRPRLMFHPRAVKAATQMKRFVWDDFRRSADRDVKQSPKPKYDDYPAMLRYLMNYEPSFRMLYSGAQRIARPGTRKGAY
jgi:hypothetical protein